MEMNDVLTAVNGKPISVGDVLVHLKTTGIFRKAIYDLIEREVIAYWSNEVGIEIEDSELHEYVTQRREGLGLADVTAVHEYCRWMGVTYDQWHAALEYELWRKKLMEHMYDADTVTTYYRANGAALKSATVSRLVVAELPDAERLARLARDDDHDFSGLARQHSIEENTRVAGGYIGAIKMGILPPEIDEAIFTAELNQVLGPFNQSGYWVLYKIDKIDYAELDESTRRQIAERLFGEWLAQQVQSARP